MTRLLRYAPDIEPGTVGEDEEGRPVRYVPATEFFPARLATAMNATIVFLGLHEGKPAPVADEEMEAVDDAIAQAYWDHFEACLTPPAVRERLRRAARGPSGGLLLEAVEEARTAVLEADDLEEAHDAHAEQRIAMVARGVEQLLTDYQVAVGEFMADYLLLQRAIREDIERAEARRRPGGTRAAVLARMDKQAGLSFEDVLGYVLRPGRVLKRMPEDRLAMVDAYARRRSSFSRAGLLSDEAPTGS